MSTLARTIAEVHRAGVVHGAVTSSAVLVDDRGLPVIRDFGRARRVSGPDDEADDVVALVVLTTALMADLGRAPDSDEARRRRRLGRMLRRCEPTSAIDFSEELASTIRQFGSVDVEEAPDQVGPPGATTSDRALRARIRARGTGRRNLSRTGFVGLAALVALAGWLLADWTTDDSPITLQPPVAPAPEPGAPEVVHDGSVYRVGRPGDVAVVRSCAGELSVWLLRPSTGALYRFDDPSADGGPVAVEPIQLATGGTDLTVQRVLDCDRLHLILPGGDEIEVGG